MFNPQPRPPTFSSSVQTARVTLTPTPGFVVKTLTTQAARYAPANPPGAAVANLPAHHKVFVNVCYAEPVPPPADIPETAKRQAMLREADWPIPCVVSDGRADVDKAGKPAMVFDVIFHPSLSDRARSDEDFRNFMADIAVESVEDKSGLSLSRDLALPKLASKGTLGPRAVLVPVPVPKPSIEVLSDTPSTPSLTADLSSPVSSAPSATSDPKRVPRWSWEELDNGSGVRIEVTLPGMTRAHHPKTTLDLEPRRLILSSPAFATLDTSLGALPRDLDVDHARAQFLVADQKLILSAGWA
ncbi:PIH1-domain-containing protein [Calocera cornea HHB12733]|uniref:PIH1-domain-containing protein n=1 Tax=Calocera cornea HHB12733 TaxID=1353952 RepID=A0A165EFI0_9BASI|nr:PIH1-domain-containing protein [Calocera cornea HHB12733]